MSSWPYPAPVDDGTAAHILPGLAVPDVALPSTDGDVVDLSRLRGVAVVFIYPWTGREGVSNPPGWDDIPGAHGSTPEAQGFRDLHASLRARGVEVYGLSNQDCAYQSELVERLELPFPILSDAGGMFEAALALPAFETGGTSYLKRLTLIIEDGVFRHRFYPVHPPDSHASEVLAWVAANCGAES